MKNIVVTIGREHGSGGRSVGKILARILGVPFYDHQIVSLAARESGLSEECVQQIDGKKPTGSFLYDLFMSPGNLPVADQVYLAERAVIEKAAQEKCVIVGRCADYVLKDRPDCLNVFIHAPLEARVRRVVEEYGDETDGDATAFVQKMDRRRASYYQGCTGRKWGDARNYDLCVSTHIGIENAAALIAFAVKRMEEMA